MCLLLSALGRYQVHTHAGHAQYATTSESSCVPALWSLQSLSFLLSSIPVGSYTPASLSSKFPGPWGERLEASLLGLECSKVSHSLCIVSGALCLFSPYTGGRLSDKWLSKVLTYDHWRRTLVVTLLLHFLSRPGVLFFPLVPGLWRLRFSVTQEMLGLVSISWSGP